MANDEAVRLDAERFAAVVRDTPLVAIDLIVRAPGGEVLLGYRSNEPARGCWFVPGGRICKGERIADAFRRITRDELGAEHRREASRLIGVYEHFYDENFAGRPGFGTHYVVLGHELRMGRRLEQLPVEQHSRYRWFPVALLLADPEVHTHVKAYFR